MDDFEGVHINRSPDVALVVFDAHLRFIDRYRRMAVGGWLEQVRHPMISLAHSLIRAPDHPLDAPIRQPRVV